MSPLTPISTLTERDIQSAVRNALAHGLDVEALGEFLSMIDWAHESTVEIRDILGELIAWADEYADGNINEIEYAERLLSLTVQAAPLRASGVFGESLTEDAPDPPEPPHVAPQRAPLQNALRVRVRRGALAPA